MYRHSGVPGEPSSRTRSASATRASVASSIVHRTHERRRHLAQKRLGARLLAAQHVAQHVRRRASMQRRSFSPAARLSGSRAKSACQVYVRREHLCVQAGVLKSESLH